MIKFFILLFIAIISVNACSNECDICATCDDLTNTSCTEGLVPSSSSVICFSDCSTYTGTTASSFQPSINSFDFSSISYDKLIIGGCADNSTYYSPLINNSGSSSTSGEVIFSGESSGEFGSISSTFNFTIENDSTVSFESFSNPNANENVIISVRNGGIVKGGGSEAGNIFSNVNVFIEEGQFVTNGNLELDNSNIYLKNQDLDIYEQNSIAYALTLGPGILSSNIYMGEETRLNCDNGCSVNVANSATLFMETGSKFRFTSGGQGRHFEANIDSNGGTVFVEDTITTYTGEGIFRRYGGISISASSLSIFRSSFKLRFIEWGSLDLKGTLSLSVVAAESNDIRLLFDNASMNIPVTNGAQLINSYDTSNRRGVGGGPLTSNIKISGNMTTDWLFRLKSPTEHGSLTITDVELSPIDNGSNGPTLLYTYFKFTSDVEWIEPEIGDSEIRIRLITFTNAENLSPNIGFIHRFYRPGDATDSYCVNSSLDLNRGAGTLDLICSPPPIDSTPPPSDDDNEEVDTTTSSLFAELDSTTIALAAGGVVVIGIVGGAFYAGKASSNAELNKLKEERAKMNANANYSSTSFVGKGGYNNPGMYGGNGSSGTTINSRDDDMTSMGSNLSDFSEATRLSSASELTDNSFAESWAVNSPQDTTTVPISKFMPARSLLDNNNNNNNNDNDDDNLNDVSIHSIHQPNFT